MVGKDVFIYDTTLRDGEQGEGISFSLQDKILIAAKLDEFGIDYIEGGWPGSNPKAEDFFKAMNEHKLVQSRLAAFGSTRRKKTRCEQDNNLRALLRAQTPVVTIFGKSWDLHVKQALKTSKDENLSMIYDTVVYLKKRGKEVIYDAEHFFDGYKNNAKYALKTARAAAEAGADTIVLCDTNGGSLPFEIQDIMAEVRKDINLPLGIHTHNDSGAAVANSLVAVQCGANHVQGTINGYGERCGNADLIQIIAALELKLNKKTIGGKMVRRLVELSHFVDEVANLIPDNHRPYVGYSAFTHKGGVHVSAVLQAPETYEHINPESVGNKRRVLVSELSGKGSLQYKAEELGVEFEDIPEEGRALLDDIKLREKEGYQFEAAEGSLELLLRKARGKHKKFFDLQGFRVIIEKRGPEQPCLSEATIKLLINGELKHMAAEGDGPVNALDSALRKALRDSYPELKKIHLSDFKVRVVDPKEGTAAKVRVIIETTDGKKQWATIGVSENIIEASWRALVDSVEYKLLKELERRVSQKKLRHK